MLKYGDIVIKEEVKKTINTRTAKMQSIAFRNQRKY